MLPRNKKQEGEAGVLVKASEKNPKNTYGEWMVVQDTNRGRHPITRIGKGEGGQGKAVKENTRIEGTSRFATLIETKEANEEGEKEIGGRKPLSNISNRAEETVTRTLKKSVMRNNNGSILEKSNQMAKKDDSLIMREKKVDDKKKDKKAQLRNVRQERVSEELRGK